MNIFKKILDILIHFVRRICYFTTVFISALICWIIYFVTYEPNTNGKVTVRKCKRIRALTKFKLYLWKYFSWYITFIHHDYFENFNNKFHFLIEK